MSLAAGPQGSSELIRMWCGASPCMSTQQKASIGPWLGTCLLFIKFKPPGFFECGIWPVLSLELVGNIHSCFMGCQCWGGYALIRKKSSFMHRRVSVAILREKRKHFHVCWGRSTKVERMMVFMLEDCSGCWMCLQPECSAEVELVAHEKEACGFLWAFVFWLESAFFYHLNLSNSIRTNEDNNGNFIDGRRSYKEIRTVLLKAAFRYSNTFNPVLFWLKPVLY